MSETTYTVEFATAAPISVSQMQTIMGEGIEVIEVRVMGVAYDRATVVERLEAQITTMRETITELFKQIDERGAAIDTLRDALRATKEQP